LISTPNHFSDTPFSRATPKPPVINTPASPKVCSSLSLSRPQAALQASTH
jgi:hypothetical protein